MYGKLLRAQHPTDLLALTTWPMLYGGLPLVVVSALIPARHVHLSGAFVLALAYAAILGMARAWLLWMFILSRVTAGIAGIASLLTPAVGMLAAWLQLGERPSGTELIGMACIVAALIVNLIPVHALPAQRKALRRGADLATVRDTLGAGRFTLSPNTMRSCC